MKSWESLAAFFGLPFLTGLPARRRRVSCPQHSSSPPSTATATHSPSFFSFAVKHPRTVVDLDGLNALSDTIALYHNNDSIENLTLHGPSHHAVRKPQPRLPIPTTIMQTASPPPPTPGSNGNVSFQTNERRDGRQPLDNGRQRHMSSVLQWPTTPNTTRPCPSRGRRQL